jgi:hypothetical protein
MLRASQAATTAGLDFGRPPRLDTKRTSREDHIRSIDVSLVVVGNENGPAFNLTDWVRHHDRYDD